MKDFLFPALLFAGFFVVLSIWGFASTEEEANAAAETIAAESGDEVVLVKGGYSRRCDVGPHESLGRPYRVVFKHDRPITLCCSPAGCLPSPYLETAR